MYVRGIKCYQFCQKFRGKYEILVEKRIVGYLYFN